MLSRNTKRTNDMKTITFSNGTLSSELVQKSDYNSSVFLNEKYDPAILGVDYVTESIIYSLKILIQIDILELEEDSLFRDLVDNGELWRFLSESFIDLFSDLHDTADGVAPTILLDFECEYKQRA